MADQPYSTPTSDVRPEPATSGEFGSIEKALSGDYPYQIGEVLSEAWEKTKGLKGSVILGIIIFYLIIIAITAVSMGLSMLSNSIAISILTNLVTTAISLPITVGLLMMGINRSIDRQVSFSMIFNYFSFLIPLLLASLLMYLLIILGLLLLILPGIYLIVAFSFALPLIVERKMGIWEALQTSRKAVTHKWFSFFGFGLLYFVIVFISAIPAGIGLIWTLPMGHAAYGILYRNMFGVEKIGE